MNRVKILPYSIRKRFGRKPKIPHQLLSRSDHLLRKLPKYDVPSDVFDRAVSAALADHHQPHKQGAYLKSPAFRWQRAVAPVCIVAVIVLVVIRRSTQTRYFYDDSLQSGSYEEPAEKHVSRSSGGYSQQATYNDDRIAESVDIISSFVPKWLKPSAAPLERSEKRRAVADSSRKASRERGLSVISDSMAGRALVQGLATSNPGQPQPEYDPRLENKLAYLAKKLDKQTPSKTAKELSSPAFPGNGDATFNSRAGDVSLPEVAKDKTSEDAPAELVAERLQADLALQLFPERGRFDDLVFKSPLGYWRSNYAPVFYPHLAPRSGGDNEYL